jgi:hypothetical protein
MKRVTESETIALDESRTLAGARFGDMIKGVVDLDDFLAGANEYRSTASSLQKYFDHFALAARRAHLSVQAIQSLSLTPARLGPYEITRAIGMGEVFRARDTMLNRDVDIKVLPGGCP